jgi:hypothetical protein
MARDRALPPVWITRLPDGLPIGALAGTLGAHAVAYGLFERYCVGSSYKTKRKEGEEHAAEAKVTILVAGVAAVQKASASREAVAGGSVGTHRAC